jgi:hypothetical protein
VVDVDRADLVGTAGKNHRADFARSLLVAVVR